MEGLGERRRCHLSRRSNGEMKWRQDEIERRQGRTGGEKGWEAKEREGIRKEKEKEREREKEKEKEKEKERKRKEEKEESTRRRGFRGRGP